MLKVMQSPAWLLLVGRRNRLETDARSLPEAPDEKQERQADVR